MGNSRPNHRQIVSLILGVIGYIEILEAFPAWLETNP